MFNQVLAGSEAILARHPPPGISPESDDGDRDLPAATPGRGVCVDDRLEIELAIDIRRTATGGTEVGALTEQIGLLAGICLQGTHASSALVVNYHHDAGGDADDCDKVPSEFDGAEYTAA